MERYRFDKDVGVYYITFTVVDWLPIFIEEATCGIVIDSLKFCIKNKCLRVNAYVLMPTHMHAIVFDYENNVGRLQMTLGEFRKFTGRQLLDFAAGHLPDCYDTVFHAQASEDRQRRFWQPTRHPVGIFTDEFWKQKIDYLHQNPCRKGLVLRPEDWRYSSALFWSTREPVDLDVVDVGWN